MSTRPTGPGDGTDNVDHRVDHVARESSRFLDAVLAAAPAARVPTCPEWDADDLLWHLGGVQRFWAEIVAGRIQDPSALPRPDRPEGRDGLAAFFRTASAELCRALAEADPAERVWTWAPEQSVGFVRRRQAQEALVHRVDAEPVAGARTGLDPVLAADGVDEVLHVMYGAVPEWGLLHPEPAGDTVRITASDVGRSWLVGLGTWSGTDPGDGTVYSEDPVLRVLPDADAAGGGQLTGTAADLVRALWNRPPAGKVTRSGDPGVLARFDANLASGVQ